MFGLTQVREPKFYFTKCVCVFFKLIDHVNQTLVYKGN